MTKTELIDKLSEKLGKTKKETGEFIDGLKEVAQETISNGEEFEIPNFVKIGIVTRAARTMRNVKTGELYDVPERKALKAKVSNGLKKFFEK